MIRIAIVGKVLLLGAMVAWGQPKPAQESRPRPIETPKSLHPSAPTVAPKGLPAEPPAFSTYQVGPEDLLAVSVLDAPEFTRHLRVSAGGTLRLPLVKQTIAAMGLTCADLEAAIIRVLVEEGLMRDPAVSVTVVEFHSRPVTVSGAVRDPQQFQATRPLTLTEAISRAGGITENAGPEIVVTVQPRDSERKIVRIPTRSILDGSVGDRDLLLRGGEEIRVPPAGRVYLLGGVTRPGTVPVTGDEPLTVLRALALAGGPSPGSKSRGFLLRPIPGGAEKQEIAINIKRLIKRQDPDLVLQPEDVIFIPDSTSKRLASVGVGSAISTLIWGGLGTVLWR